MGSATLQGSKSHSAWRRLALKGLQDKEKRHRSAEARAGRQCYRTQDFTLAAASQTRQFHRLRTDHFLREVE
jgi:hypothetical protein